jgi:hypothetical protein
MVHALARIQAEWWDHPRLGISVGKWLDNLAIGELMERFTGLYKSFADRLGMAFHCIGASCTSDLFKPRPDSLHAIKRVAIFR